MSVQLTQSLTRAADAMVDNGKRVSGDASIPEQNAKTRAASDNAEPSSESESTTLTAEAVEPTELEQAVSAVQDFVQSVQRDLNFELDDASGQVVVKVIESESGEVIRQFPSEEALGLAASVEESRSLLFSAKA